MKLSSFTALFILSFHTMCGPKLVAQTRYHVNTSATQQEVIFKDRWIQPLTYATLKQGMRFYMMPPVPSSSEDLKMRNAKHTWANKLKREDFGGKIFTYISCKKVMDGYDPKIEFLFACEDKAYVTLGNVTDDETKLLTWEESGLIWLDEIDSVKQLLEGKTAWITTTEWKYETAGSAYTQEQPQQFVPVVIEQVGIGTYTNEPARILFKAQNGRKYYIDAFISGSLGTWWGSANNIATCISLNDPKKEHPLVHESWWPYIQKQQVVNGMTIEACQLALGVPEALNEYQLKRNNFKVLSFPRRIYRQVGYQLTFKNDALETIVKEVN